MGDAARSAGLRHRGRQRRRRLPGAYGAAAARAALLLLAIGMFVVARTDDGFRFVWGGDEGELFLFTIVLGMIALVLLTPRFSGPRAGLSGYARGLVYLGASLVFVYTAFLLGTAHFERAQCSSPDFDGECDVAVLEGLVWAVVALVVALAVIVTVEVVRRRRTPGSTP